ncbi:MAG: hypothetical protein GC193_05000 [Cryomorphaceae bacterium]|nr:hypothetical protein [Cryomorphaceae bacterium]
MNELKMSDKVEAFFSKANPDVRATMEAIRSTILGLPIEIVEEVKWGVPCYAHCGLIMGMGSFKNHVALNFFKGTMLDDGFGVFDDNNSGEVMRSVRIVHGVKPNLDAIADLVLQAAKVNASGAAVESNRVKKELEVPKWFEEALKAIPGIFDFFESLSPSHKKEFVEYVTSAKKEETRLKRLAKSIDLMQRGSGLNDQYKNS